MSSRSSIRFAWVYECDPYNYNPSGHTDAAISAGNLQLMSCCCSYPTSEPLVFPHPTHMTASPHLLQARHSSSLCSHWQPEAPRGESGAIFFFDLGIVGVGYLGKLALGKKLHTHKCMFIDYVDYVPTCSYSILTKFDIEIKHVSTLHCLRG